MNNSYDVIVIGGGHAGIEAACASAKMGLSVALLTMSKDAIGRMSCNPAIGGTAKGHLVREVDAIGGMMGLISDKTGIQFRMLNKSKGPAVWSPRSQNDRDLYSAEAIRVVESHENIAILEDSAISILIEDKTIKGVLTQKTGEISAKAVVLCSGTFLNGLMHTGMNSVSGGRFGEKPATGITESLLNAGFEAARLKTGTPPRLDKNSINWELLELQPGDTEPQPFSFRTNISQFPFQPQLPCHITYTDANVHKILEKGFSDSPLFTGVIKGTGPRYCPSIEDKIVRFSDKLKHQLFLEPEGLNTNLIYVNGFSTSLPAGVQLEAIHNIKGLEKAVMIRPGYAVEYDFFPPHQVDLTLETKLVQGLFFAGQINGTSGYEEAAAQGLMAGINAALKIKKEKEFILQRSEAYIGVLIDDLVSKSTEEPYRMFTSRAEHRLLLRADNADLRLSEHGIKFGLLNKDYALLFRDKQTRIYHGRLLAEKIKITPKEVNTYFTLLGSSSLDNTETIGKLTCRPEVNLKDLLKLSIPEKLDEIRNIVNSASICEQIEIELKYEGYIKRQYQTVAKLEKYEHLLIPIDFDYSVIKSLSNEGREKLKKVKPRSIGLATRISGVSPSDISILLVYLKH